MIYQKGINNAPLDSLYIPYVFFFLTSPLFPLQKGTPVHKYLRELDEKFEEFLQRHMKDYWLQLDDSTACK